MLAYLGDNTGPIVGLSCGYVGPSRGYIGPIMGPMLVHVDPSRGSRAEKLQKMGREQKMGRVQNGKSFWPDGGGNRSATRGRSIFLKERKNMSTARIRQGAPWLNLRIYADWSSRAEQKPR